MRNAGGTRDKVTTVCAPTPATTHYVPGARRREERKKKEEKGKENPISNPAFDQTRTAKRITVQRVARESLSLSTGHVAVTYCLVFRDYWSGGTLESASSKKSQIRTSRSWAAIDFYKFLITDFAGVTIFNASN